jgi:hypothetical protein
MIELRNTNFQADFHSNLLMFSENNQTKIISQKSIGRIMHLNKNSQAHNEWMDAGHKSEGALLTIYPEHRKNHHNAAKVA